MSRHEADREDLMQEATALRQRIELFVPHEVAPVVAGFRDEGRLSIYFGADPVYHFDDRGRLRRAFFEGALYRTQGDTLARLDRSRGAGKSELLRRDLTPAELQSFCASMRSRLQSLSRSLAAGSAQIVRQVPADAPHVARLSTILVQILHAEPWLAPAIKGKR